MKRILLFLSIIFAGFAANATVDTLAENFNGSCVLGSGWLAFNPASTVGDGIWQCSDIDGRYSTGGMECSNFFSSAFHLDTSYLITPELNLSATKYQQGGVYLRFDAKTTVYELGARLATFTDTLVGDTTFPTMAFSPAPDSSGYSSLDSSDWRTHYVNITSYVTHPFYFAFRYTGPTTQGSTWYIDNVNIVVHPVLSVINESVINLPLKVLGASTTDEINVSFTASGQEQYTLHLYDIMGREVHQEALEVVDGYHVYKIKDLSLQPGMYFVKIGNGSSYGVAKTIVQ